MTTSEIGATTTDPEPLATRGTGRRRRTSSRGEWSARAARRVARTVWFWPAVAMTAFAGFRLGLPNMDQDELATVSAINRPSHRIFQLLHHIDAVHGAYYLFLHEWAKVFGMSPVALRIPSAVAVIGAAVCVAMIGERLFGHRAGMLGGVLFAIVPSISRYGQGIRPYGFVVFFVALSTLLLLRALGTPWLRWLPYAVSVAAMGYCNLVSLVVLAGHGCVVVVDWLQRGAQAPQDRNRHSARYRYTLGLVLRRDAWQLLLFPAACALAYLMLKPLITVGQQQQGHQIMWVEHPDLARLVSIQSEIFSSTLLAWVLLPTAACAWLINRRSAALATIMILVPLAAVWKMSQVSSAATPSYFLARYLLFVVPMVAVLAGAVVARLGTRGMVAATMALALLAVPGQREVHSTVGHANYLYPSALWFTPMDYRGAADIIAAGYQPGDGAVYGRGNTAYFAVDVGVKYYLPANVKPRDVFQEVPETQIPSLTSVECGNDAAHCLGTEPRLWMATTGDLTNPLTGATGPEATALAQNYTVSHIWHVSGLTVSLLVHK